MMEISISLRNYTESVEINGLNSPEYSPFSFIHIGNTHRNFNL